MYEVEALQVFLMTPALQNLAGGADPAGSGLSGLRNRVEAVDGKLAIDSPAGGGTTVTAELPCE